MRQRWFWKIRNSFHFNLIKIRDKVDKKKIRIFTMRYNRLLRLYKRIWIYYRIRKNDNRNRQRKRIWNIETKAHGITYWYNDKRRTKSKISLLQRTLENTYWRVIKKTEQLLSFFYHINKIFLNLSISQSLNLIYYLPFSSHTQTSSISFFYIYMHIKSGSFCNSYNSSPK